MSTFHSPVNRSLLFWCCKPLGLACFKHLLNLIDHTYPTVSLAGIVISTRDQAAAEIEKLAITHDIPLYDETSPILTSADLGICIGFPKKLPLSIIHRCRHGLINLHFAPLPYYRGSGTLTHAIVNQENRYGLTFHYMDESLDTGPIIATKWMNIDNDQTAADLTLELEQLGFSFFQEWIERFLNEVVPATDQTTIMAREQVSPRFCTKESVKKMYHLSLEWPFEKIHRYVRALTLGKPIKPYFEKEGKKLFISLSE